MSAKTATARVTVLGGVCGSFVESTGPEWKAMWATLAATGENIDADEPDSGEYWQYMGSDRDPCGRWSHSFRHRHHPATHTRVYRRVPASPVWAASVEPEAKRLLGQEAIDLERKATAERQARHARRQVIIAEQCGDYSGSYWPGLVIVSDADPGL